MKAASPVVYGQAMLGIGRSVSGVVVRGIDPDAGDGVIDIEKHLKSGSLADLGRPQPITLPADEGGGTVELPGIMIGQELARQLGVGAGRRGERHLAARHARARPAWCRA